MDRFKSVILLVLLIFFTAETDAQTKKSEGGLPPEVMAWTKSTLDAFSYKQYNSLKEAMIDNDYYIPTVFKGGIFPELNFDTDLGMPKLNISSPYSLSVDYVKIMFWSHRIRKLLEDGAYKEMLKNPSNFKYTIYQLSGGHVIKPESINKSNEPVKLEVKSTLPAPGKASSVVKFIPDRRYWTSSFKADIKFSQSKSSDNWHQGKIENMNINTYTLTNYKYVKGKVTLENTLTTQFVINTAPNDTLRDYTIGTDELRFRSNFGLKAIRNWSYSASAELVTSMGNKYIANTRKKQSAFLSPYAITLGGGITYAVSPKFKTPNRSVTITLTISPVAFKFTYSNNKNVNLAAFFPRNQDGTPKFVTRSFGPDVNLICDTKFSKSVSLYTRLNYFTSYERITSDMDNKLSIALSRYFSTTFQVILRYDDRVSKKKESDSFLQLNELFSFGFSYTW